ncbi:MAG TPA: CHAT domain-containing protein [Turneriella sp.]|nr:CHAT domain-containing protein [Turneriella sp.]
MILVIATEISKEQIEIIVSDHRRLESRTHRTLAPCAAVLKLVQKWEKLYQHENIVNPDGDYLYRKIQLLGRDLSRLLFNAEPPWGDNPDRIHFIADAALQRLPIEILPFQERLLAEKLPILRSLKTDSAPTPKRTPLKSNLFLLVVDVNRNETMRKGLQAEYKNALNENRKYEIEAYQADKIRLDDVRQKLQESAYFHFAGHGEAASLPLWQTDKLTHESLHGLDLTILHTAFVNSCYSSKTDTRVPTLAEAFINAGAKNYIGYSLPISNDAAYLMAAEFWRHLKASRRPDLAVHKARQAAVEKFGTRDFGWLALHCYASQNSAPRSPVWGAAKIAAAVLLLCIPLAYMLTKNFSTPTRLKESTTRTNTLDKPSPQHSPPPTEKTKKPTTTKNAQREQYKPAAPDSPSLEKLSAGAKRIDPYSFIKPKTLSKMRTFISAAKNGTYVVKVTECEAPVKNFVYFYDLLPRYVAFETNPNQPAETQYHLGLAAQNLRDATKLTEDAWKKISLMGCVYGLTEPNNAATVKPAHPKEAASAEKLTIEPQRAKKMQAYYTAIQKPAWQPPSLECETQSKIFMVWYKGRPFQKPDVPYKSTLSPALYIANLNKLWDTIESEGCIESH